MYRVFTMLLICLFATLNVTVGLLDQYFVCQWKVRSTALLNFLMVIVTVPVVSYGVTPIFALLFGGWIGAPVPPGAEAWPWKLFTRGLPNVWSKLAIFFIYWGLVVGRMFWQDGGAPNDTAGPTHLAHKVWKC